MKTDKEELPGTSDNNVAYLVKKLQTSGALVKPKTEYHCFTCDQDYTKWGEFENHLLDHVSLPSIILPKLSDSQLDESPSGDENWSDDEVDDEMEAKPVVGQIKAFSKKMDLSQILNKSGLSIKKPGQSTAATSALDKLSGLGLLVKKNASPVKQEKVDPEINQSNQDLMQKLGQLGGIKLKLKSDGSNTNTFKVINGLKDFKTSDDEQSGNEAKSDEDQDENYDSDEKDISDEVVKSEVDPDSGDEANITRSRKSSESEENTNNIGVKLPNISGIKVQPKAVVSAVDKNKITIQRNTIMRPQVKQTPRRNTMTPDNTQSAQQKSLSPPIATDHVKNDSDVSKDAIGDVVVKKEIDDQINEGSNVPIFNCPIKTERASPPPSAAPNIPLTAKVKTEEESAPSNTPSNGPPNQETKVPRPLLPVTKQEDSGIIEINCDDDDDDDDCCVVSTTPAPDVKPIVPKTEHVFTTPTSYPAPQPNRSTAPTILSSRLMNTTTATSSTEKQHSFNWNAPDSKGVMDMNDKSTDDLFDTLFSTKKENLSLSDASEFISLDRLGPQHSCDVCNTRFTDPSLLNDHIRTTGHSKSIVTPSSTLLPYSQPSNALMSTLFPVKQLAEQVGKLSGMTGAGSGAFTHQQNVMINIQAYPGASSMMQPGQPYNAYAPGQPMNPGYQGTNPMYDAQGQPIPGHAYPNSPYGQQGYGQMPYQQHMNKPGYPPGSTYPGTAAMPNFSTPSPLQSMQQAVYGTSPMMTTSPGMGQMPPPNQYAPPSSPGTMKSPAKPTGVKIQNIQTFPPGQLGPIAMGQSGPMQSSGQMNTPIRVSNPGAGPRARMPTMRGGASRPSIRPGLQVVQGQTVRGGKAAGPRMPLKRTGAPTAGPSLKKRPDMLLPGRHDNEDCTVMAMQKQRDGMPMIHSVQGAKDRINIGSQISVTKKTVNREANAVANVLASRGIMIKQKQKSRSPTPERPIPHIPNLGTGVSIKHTSKSSNFSIPEQKVGAGMYSCKICRKQFMNQASLNVHITSAHPQSKVPTFKCDECPASYPKSLQLQHHKRTFHNVTGPNRELGIPVVDLSQEDNLKRLRSLGIYSFIPLANREQASGCFSIPIISVHNASNGFPNSLQALGADGLLSLGPLKALPNT